MNFDNDLVFDSNFEGGNLDQVIKTSANKYSLFLRTDSNSNTHTLWFFFSMSNTSKNQEITFSFENITKRCELYL